MNVYQGSVFDKVYSPVPVPVNLRSKIIIHSCPSCGKSVTFEIDGDCDPDQRRFLGRCMACEIHIKLVITTFDGMTTDGFHEKEPE